MEGLFFKVLGMSATAAAVILAVLLARLLLRRAPKVFSYALWAVALLRLLCPFTLDSAFSLLPSAKVVTVDGRGESAAQVIRIQTGIGPVDRQVNDFFMEHPYQGQTAGPEGAGAVPAPPLNQPGPAPDWRTVPAMVWLAGAAALLGYSVVSMLRLRRKLVGWVPLEGEKNVRLADHIPSPFVLGVFQPKIYLPSGLPEGERDYVLLHERTHIRRCDHIFRALAWLALAIHWFNPLVWLAFHLAGRDMEMSCDEAVLRRMGRDVRADYSSSLLRLSTGKRLPAGPLAFGGGDPQSRIKNVLRWKKPALWVVAVALIAVVCAGAALATDRGAAANSPEPDDGLSCAFNDDRTAVLITGGRAENLQWFPPGQSDFADEVIPQGALTFAGLTLGSGWDFSGVASWAGDNRNAVKIELIRAPLVLDYTVLVEGSAHPEQAVIERKASGDEGVDPGLSDKEAAELAAYFAHCLRAAESWYLQQAPADGIPPDGFNADLALSLDTTGEEPCVRVEGSVGDVTLEQGAFWHPASWSASGQDYPYGYLSMVYPGFAGEIDGSIYARWTDGGRRSVTVDTRMMAMIRNYTQTGWWEFTVELDSGTVTAMTGHPLLEDAGAELLYCPASISDGEAVETARIAAKLLTAAEDYYANAQHGGLSLAYVLDEGNGSGDVRIIGLVDGYASWSADTSPSGGNLYFAGIPASCCPRLAGRGIEGSAIWTDETHTAVSVVMNVDDDRVVSGTVSGFYIHFVVDLTDMTAIRSEFESEIEGETLELNDQEMADMARVLAQALEGAEDYYGSASESSGPAPEGIWMEVAPGTVTPTGLTYQIHNESQGKLMYGNPFGLQAVDGGIWHRVRGQDTVVFTLEGYMLDGNASASKTIDWGYAYGELPPGHYRITTEVRLEQERKTITLSAEFEIEA